MQFEAKTTTEVEGLGTEIYTLDANEADMVSRTNQSTTRIMLTNGDIAFTVGENNFGLQGCVVSQDGLRIICGSPIFRGTTDIVGDPNAIITPAEIVIVAAFKFPFFEDTI